MKASQIEKSRLHSLAEFVRLIYRDAVRALGLDEDVYKPYVAADAHYMRKGFGILFWLLLPAAITISLGLVFDWLSMPRADLFQDALFNFIDSSALFKSLVMQYSLLETYFPIIYGLIWLVIRVSGGYPFLAGIALAPLSFIGSNMVNLWLFGLLLMVTARLMGGKAPRGSIFPALALAFAPQMLNILNLIPGLSIPSSLISIWTGMTAYQVIRNLYGFSSGRSLGTLVLAATLKFTLTILAILLGVIVGVGYSIATM